MATLEASLSTFSFSSFSCSSSSKFRFSQKPFIINLGFSKYVTGTSLKFPLCPFQNPSRRRVSAMCSATEAEAETGLQRNSERSQPPNVKRKLFVLNLPWSLTVSDIKELFGQCGTVSDVEIIKQKSGRNEGFAFVSMGSGEEAQAAVDKLDCHQVSERIIRVDFARRFRKPSSNPPSTLPSSRETKNKVYVSNLAWEVRSTHLREFFGAANFNTVSARVVFGKAERAAGYGFVSFATREEAKSAIAELNGKELMNRPIRLKFSESKLGNAKRSENRRVPEDGSSEDQPNE